MRMFITGATGWVSSAIVKDFLSSGHGGRGLLTTTSEGPESSCVVEGARWQAHEHDLLREAAPSRTTLSTPPSSTACSNISLSTRVRLLAGALNNDGMVANFLGG